ncbi:hypothetical protein, partial [Lysobacter sp. A03]|uniref:hypothetical protein n=1 Tax=Lysobacter sp. A03 TaxID=1199154 RepID=UPI001F24EF50
HPEHDTPLREAFEVGRAAASQLDQIGISERQLDPGLVDATPRNLELGVVTVTDLGRAPPPYPSALLLFFTRSAST